ncbi:MAG TPA: DNA repair protein RecN [Steroidobacteraceae bacterium]|jgi:DNA repair protein RecN (Recombination protein N)|nr:DNA repair protein RecN [Steroidobacteraceae bacterium]
MLTHLQLRDLVLVDRAELELGPGLTALTGETGAGKSIVVDALLLVAGGRAGSDIVRQGAERAEVTAGFDGLPPGARAWLEAQAIETDGELIVRRMIGADGRSRGFVNGQLVPMQALRELADFLIEIHGQQEFQRLVNRSTQRELLDGHLADAGQLAAVAETFVRYRDCRRELDALQSAAQNRDSRLELLRFQLSELQAEVTTTADIEALFVDQKRISSRGRLAAAARAALDAVYEAEDVSAHDLLGKAQSALRNAGDPDPTLTGAAEQIGDAMIHVREASDSLRRLLEALDIDPARQEEIERRAAALEALARKHRVPRGELPEQLRLIGAELASLENAAVNMAALDQRLAELAAAYRGAAARLSAGRRAAATHLGGQVTGLMQGLGMAGGRFEAAVTTREAEFAASGSDEIEFLVSANPGQAPKSLAKVASGGELSRISLAVQVAAAARTGAPCMVFDEVDSGIGGAVAEIVGRQLRELGGRAQVLCVTHLAQVASQAHGQFRVTKLSDGKTTRTSVKRLGDAERIDEIARMLGGVDITEPARVHAREMLSLAAPAPSSGRSDGPAKRKRAPGRR